MTAITLPPAPGWNRRVQVYSILKCLHLRGALTDSTRTPHTSPADLALDTAAVLYQRPQS